MLPIQTQVHETTSVSNPGARQVEQRTTVSRSPGGMESPPKAYQTKKALYHTYQVIWYILGFIEVLLVARFMLKLLGANAESGFVAFIYALSQPLAYPFLGILGTSNESGVLLEWSTLVAMLVYAILAYGLVALFQLVKPTTENEVERTIDNS